MLRISVSVSGQRTELFDPANLPVDVRAKPVDEIADAVANFLRNMGVFNTNQRIGIMVERGGERVEGTYPMSKKS